MDVQLREARATDAPAIRDVIMAAFGKEQGPEVAELVAGLGQDLTAQPVVSLVAAAGARVAGHVLFSRTRLGPGPQPVLSAILATLAVHPDHQGQGIGGRLVRRGLDRLRAMGVGLVFVLGHPGYYPRHGFVPAGMRGVEAPYPIPPEHAGAWMVLELRAGIIGSVAGRVECADALRDPRHWRE